MKSLKYSIVTLAIICLCAVSANADMLLDSLNYPSNAALQAAWGNVAGWWVSQPVIATENGVSCMDGPVNYELSTARANWADNVSLNLTGCTGISLSFVASDPTQISSVWVYIAMDNSAGTYGIPLGAPTTNWQTYTSSISSATFYNEGDSAGNLANVTGLSISAYANAGTGTDVYFSDLTAVGVTPVPEPGSLLALGIGLFGMGGFVIRRRS